MTVPTPDLGELYQAVILDHNRSPRNFREIPDASGDAQGYNPLCGDQVHIWVKVEDGRVADCTFRGDGCAISKASASLMTTALKGKTVAEAEALFEQFHRTLTGGTSASDRLPSKLEVFRGVAAFPIRVKCATLAWHAFREALESSTSPSQHGSGS